MKFNLRFLWRTFSRLNPGDLRLWGSGALAQLPKLRSNKGSLLIISVTVLYIMIVLTAGYSMIIFGEMSAAQRYRDSAVAFWLAETGITRYLHNPGFLTNWGKIFYEKTGTIVLNKKDLSSERILTSTGNVRGVRREIQVKFSAKPPVVFDNVMSTGGDLVMNGDKTAVTINSRLRVGGKIMDKAKYSTVLIEDKKENVSAPRTTLTYPDADGNGKPDEFSDFAAFNRNLVASYPKDDVIYIQGDDAYAIVLNPALTNKRIIFVDGKAGLGNVTVQLMGNWEENQNLTIISSGSITFNQEGKMPSSSQLNIISWAGYHESSALPSVHNGVVYTHGKATFDHIYDNSVTNGNVIANDGIELGEIWSRKTFNYADVRRNGLLPPGFEGLFGARQTGYDSVPGDWKEM